MPEIEISGEQLDYLDGLRADLEDRFVDGYGHVRRRDALQYLIDRYEADGASVEGAGTGETSGDDADTGMAGTDADAGAAAADADDEAAGSDADGADRLQTMMGLLDRYDDAWEETGDEEGKYLVALPDGGTEYARTKDDVRALLFEHYR